MDLIEAELKRTLLHDLCHLNLVHSFNVHRHSILEADVEARGGIFQIWRVKVYLDHVALQYCRPIS